MFIYYLPITRLLLSASIIMASGGPEQRIFQGEGDSQSLLSAFSRFSAEIYKEQRKRSAENIFLSPFSILAALGMTYLGAKGKTKEEMKTALFFTGIDDEKLHQGFSDIMAFLKSYSTQTDPSTNEPVLQLQVANRLFAEQSFTILEEFQIACKKFYNSETALVSYSTKVEDAINAINTWVEENTNQKIKNLVSSPAVNAGTLLVLVNAIYFKGSWQTAFKESSTEKADFHVSKDKKIEVQMMFQKVKQANYFFSKDLHCQVLKLPYKQKAASMIILLPDAKLTSLEDVESKLTADNLENLDSQFKLIPEVNLWLPKFKMEEKLELAEVLELMGMKSLFRSADLSGIDGDGKLFVSSVVHKAFVDVNEKGTEAAAATAVIMTRSAAPRAKNPIDFRANHPFLFLIREESTKIILFFGRAMKPQSP